MSRDILNPKYWRQRLDQAKAAREVHRAIFVTTSEKWNEIEKVHKDQLAKIINPTDSILDVGCGWGRLLSLLPSTWEGQYVGVDLSPDFIRMAQNAFFHSTKLRLHAFPFLNPQFVLGDMLDLRTFQQLSQYQTNGKFDWAVMISFRPMVIRELGIEKWEIIKKRVATLTKNLLYLEYDPKVGAEIETS